MAVLQEQQIQRLLDIGYTIAHSGSVIPANNIFDAILLENKENTPALIGKALTAMMLDKFEECEEGLKKILEKNENDQEARALLSLCYYLSGSDFNSKEQAQKIDSEQQEAYDLAQGILKELG